MTTGSDVANQAVQGVLQRIDALAAKIGTTAAHVWDVYVQQARVEAIRDGLVGALILVIGGFIFRTARGFRKEGDIETASWFYFAGIFALVVAGYWFYGVIGEGLNPQYWAFQHLTADLKNLL